MLRACCLCQLKLYGVLVPCESEREDDLLTTGLYLRVEKRCFAGPLELPALLVGPHSANVLSNRERTCNKASANSQPVRLSPIIGHSRLAAYFPALDFCPPFD